MLRTALALLSSLQVGLRIRESIERSVRQAIVVAVALVILIIAVLFGLFAAYQLLIAHGFTPAAAAGIIAATLFLLSMLVLASLPLFTPRPKREAPSMAMAASEGVSMIDRGVGKAMQQVGPITMLAIAFVAGILASRRR
jgi:drug/metabolite transporter (DMT)-like permease